MTDSSSGENSDEEDHTPCEYVFSPDDSRNHIRTALTTEWSCPHPAVDESNGEQLCIFHLPVDEKKKDAVRDRFVECVSMRGGAPKRFVGAKFEELSLINRSIGSVDNNPIDLRNSIIEGDVFIDGSSVRQALILTEAEIQGSVFARATRFFEPILAQHATFEGGGVFDSAEFHDRANFRNSVFGDSTTFKECSFEDQTSFYGCDFNVEEPNPSGPRTQGHHRESLIDFSGTTFEEEINLNSATFNDTLFFNNISSNGITHMKNIDLNGKFHTYEFMKSEWDTTSFEEQMIGHAVAELQGDFTELRLSFETTVEEPCMIYLNNSEIQKGHLTQLEEGYAYFNLSGASLGDVSLENMDSAEDWKHLIFRNTDFNGLNFTDYHPPLEDLGYDLYEVRKPAEYDWFSDRDLQERETTFLKARIGADKVSDYRASSEFHILELDTRRHRLRTETKWGQYIAHLAYGVSSKYGEKPGQVLAVFSPVLLIAYWFTNVQPTASTLSLILGFILAILPPIFSALLVLSSSRYIGN